jgi:F-type H+-transporting ATPase subunit delta
MEPRVAKKYATALFTLSQQRGITDIVWADLTVLAGVIKEDKRLLKVLAAPQISDESKHELVRNVLVGAHEVVTHFVLFIIDKGRTDNLVRIVEIYGHLLDEARGIVVADITSAIPLAEPEVKRIVARLETLSGKKVRHHLHVDPEILGGVIIVIGGEIIDYSVRHDLSRLRDALYALKVHEAV